MSLLPWERLLGAAARMGIAPEAFWRMSLKEWRMIVGQQEKSLGRGELDALARLYPDEDGRHERG